MSNQTRAVKDNHSAYWHKRYWHWMSQGCKPAEAARRASADEREQTVGDEGKGQEHEQK